MRRMMLGVLISAVILLCVSPIYALELKGRLAITPQVGRIIPDGNFTSGRVDTSLGSVKTGIGMAFDAEYYIFEKFSLGINLFYNYFGQETKDYRRLYPTIQFNGHWTVKGIQGFVRYIFATREQTRYYVRAGLISGKVTGKIEATAGTTFARIKSEVATATGWAGAVGFLHNVSPRTGLFSEVCYSHLDTQGKDTKVTIVDRVVSDEGIVNTRWLAIRAGITVFIGVK